MLKITIEGPPGSGKTTLARIIYLMLSSIGGQRVEVRDGDVVLGRDVLVKAIIETKQTQ